MDRLGRRETGGLVVLAVAVLITATFLFPGTSSGADPLPFQPGIDVAGSPTPAAPTDSPIPLPEPATWKLTYYALKDGQRTEASTAAVKAVDISIPTTPSPGMEDDSWLLQASATVSGGPARYVFTVEHQSDVHVLVDGVEVASQASSSTVQALVVTFEHRTRRDMRITVEARDVGGSFSLKIRPGS